MLKHDRCLCMSISHILHYPLLPNVFFVTITSAARVSSDEQENAQDANAPRTCTDHQRSRRKDK